MKKINAILITLVLLSSLNLSLVAYAVEEDYGDVSLSGGSQSGDFSDVWDLTAGDMVISFTYDGNGLVDEFGGAAHAWAQLGVRSFDTGSNFNPYSPLRTVGYEYDCTSTLYADQDVPVGTVTVAGDEDMISVEYELDDPWLMFQAHLHIAVDLSGVPQARGNPIPGRFMISIPYDPPVDGDSFDIDLIDVPGYTEGAVLYIAAHAVVGRPLDCSETVWQIGDVEELVDYGTYWALSNYADEFNWGDPAGPTTAGPTLAVEQPPFTTPFIVGTTPTEEFPYNSNKVADYATDIDVVWSGGLPFGGTLIVSWSPGVSAVEKKVVSDEGFPATTLTATGSPQAGMGWFLNKYPLVQHDIAVGQLAEGEHTINFLHTQGDGTFWDWIRLEKPCEQRETAWADETPFPGKNWATYMTCTPEPVQVEGSGVWLSTDYDWTVNTFDPDPEGSPTLDIDDKLILQRRGGDDEGYYNLPSVPPNKWANHRVWFDRDGVDQWQAQNPLAVDGGTYNTGGVYEIEIHLHANSATEGTAYMKINGLWQGFETDGNWNTIELSPAGMTFTGDMKNLVVFYGIFGYGATHSVEFRDITVTQ